MEWAGSRTWMDLIQNMGWAGSRTQDGLDLEHGMDWIQTEHRNKLEFSKEGEQLILSPKVEGVNDTG